MNIKLYTKTGYIKKLKKSQNRPSWQSRTKDLEDFYTKLIVCSYIENVEINMPAFFKNISSIAAVRYIEKKS